MIDLANGNQARVGRMANQLYNWTRFWTPRGEDPLWDGGFLSECQSKMGRILNPKPVTLESVEPSISCLVLLGEPGIGKSKELEKQKQLTQSRISESADDVLFFELGIYSSTDLRKEVFENSTIENWSRGTNNLYLFLDSLDEGRLAVNALTRLLAHKLKDLPRDRLRLRITCRTAEWQSSGFEDELVALFGSDAVKVLELRRCVTTLISARRRGEQERLMLINA